jgi:uncharacterized protein YbcC (UPF0753/DUF2309 family)
MRLTAIVEAPRERIEACLARHEGPRELVENGWLHLLAWDAEAGRFHRFVSLESGWEPFAS